VSILRTISISAAALALACASALAAKPADTAPKPAAAPAKPRGPMTLIMRGLDKITGRATTVLVPIGQSAQYATFTVTAKYCYTTPSTETPETAAFVQVEDHRPDQAAHRIFSGWMYASSPGLHGVEHPLYDIWVITCRAVAPGEMVTIGPAKVTRPVSPDASDRERPEELPEGAGQ
jgi:hypothetical protein